MIERLLNPFRVGGMILASWGDAMDSAWTLGRAALAARREPGGAKAALAAALADPTGQRRVADVLRVVSPNLSLNAQVIKAYPNTGTVLVTRRADVAEVLARDSDFEVVYEMRMRKLTDGENFFLGMQPGWDYTCDVSAMRLAARRSDVAGIILPRADELAERIVAESGGRLDLPQDLTLAVPWDMTDRYFGVGGPDAATMQEWTTTLFWYLFGDLNADPAVEVRALEQAAAMRGWLDHRIAERKRTPAASDDVLGRCLALQAAGTPGMDDLGIRNNLLGLLIGAIPTISKACCLALDELLRRPEALAEAQSAARADDDARLAACIWEALRFNPHNPIVYRRATRDTVIAQSSLRHTSIRKGQMVIAVTLSAMFDRAHIAAPRDFRFNRAFDTYIIWGAGLHQCFGAAINEAIIPAILKPVLARPGLRRAEGETGRVDTGGTPFPQHFVVEFDA